MQNLAWEKEAAQGSAGSREGLALYFPSLYSVILGAPPPPNLPEETHTDLGHIYGILLERNTKLVIFHGMKTLHQTLPDPSFLYFVQ